MQSIDISCQDKIRYSALPSFFKARTKRLPDFNDLIYPKGKPISKHQQKLEFLKLCAGAYRLQQSHPDLNQLYEMKKQIPHEQKLKHLQIDLAIEYQQHIDQKQQSRFKMWLTRYFKGGPDR